MTRISDSRKSAQPIFIGGIQRSGTSLVRSVIGSHPEIAIFQFDLPLWIKFYPIFKYKKVNEQNALLLLSDMLNHAKTKLCEIQLDEEALKQQVREAEVEDFADVIHLFLTAYANALGRKTYGHKTPFNEYFVEDIFRTFPNARFIHVIRNPLDAAVSVMKAREKWWGGKNNIYQHIHQWERSVDLGEYYLKKYENQYLLLKYEELVLHQEKAIHNLCEFLNIPFDDAMLKMENHAGWKGTNSSFDLKTPKNQIYAASIGRYRQQLDVKTANIYRKVLHEKLKRYEYDEGISSAPGFALLLRYTMEKAMENIKSGLILWVQRSPLYRFLKKIMKSD